MKWMQIYLPMLLISVSVAYGGSLQGTVRNAQSFIPIVGVNVTVHIVNPDSVALPATTDQNGSYSITGIIPGNKVYAVVTYTSGYVMSYARIENLGALDLTYDINLTPEAGLPPVGGSDSSAMLGTIMSPSTDNRSLLPIANAQVKLVSGSLQFDAVTNSEGKYTKIIPLGLYFVTVSAAGYNNLTTTGVRVEQTGAIVNAILKSIGTGISTDPEQSRPDRYALADAYPNPFNPTTAIRFTVGADGHTTLRVFDLLGHEVALLVNEEKPAGSYYVIWNASIFSSGLYFCRLEAIGKNKEHFVETKKLVLLK